MSNLTEDGWDLTELKYLDVEDSPEAWRLQHGDVVVNRTNSEELVGKAAVFDIDDEAGPWLYASYLLRVRVNQSLILPTFLVAFLNSPAGRLQVDRVSRRAVGMANINTTEIGNFLVPLPSVHQQAALLEPLLEALDERLARIGEARLVLTSTDADLLASVGISPPSTFADRSYATTARKAASIARLGAQFFHPERAGALRSVLNASTGDAQSLVQLAEFVNDRCTPAPGEAYVGLSAVEPHTGELLPIGEEASDAKRYQRGDVLYARLRPYLNKVHLAESDGICSTEFYVLRPVEGVDGRFLAMAVEADAQQLALRVPDLTVQRSLATSFVQRRDEALALGRSAETAWTNAQNEFDAALLA